MTQRRNKREGRGVFAEALSDEIIGQNPAIGVHDHRKNRQEQGRLITDVYNSSQMAHLFNGETTKGTNKDSKHFSREMRRFDYTMKSSLVTVGAQG